MLSEQSSGSLNKILLAIFQALNIGYAVYKWLSTAGGPVQDWLSSPQFWIHVWIAAAIFFVFGLLLGISAWLILKNHYTDFNDRLRQNAKTRLGVGLVELVLALGLATAALVFA